MLRKIGALVNSAGNWSLSRVSTGTDMVTFDDTMMRVLADRCQEAEVTLDIEPKPIPVE